MYVCDYLLRGKNSDVYNNSTTIAVKKNGLLTFCVLKLENAFKKKKKIALAYVPVQSTSKI